MDKVCEISVRNSELAIAKEKRAFLVYPMDGLASCSLEEQEDGICLTFETEGLQPAGTLLSKSLGEHFDRQFDRRLRFLINCADLEKLYDEYDFSLSSDNLMIDINLRPLVLLRDIANGSGDADNRSCFLPKYKALIGSFLIRKYNYEDFAQGGEGLYKKNKLALEISEMESVADIKNRLLKEYHGTISKTHKTKRLVSKKSAFAARIAVPVLILALLASGFFTAYAFIFDIPYGNQVIAANEAYIAGNHLEVQRALAGFAVNALTHETKHILSRAYVATEPLSIDQRDNILMGLTLITDTSIFDYWIHLGRLEFYEAIDIAQRFGDNELLLFAYLRQEAVVIADPHMPGSEKVAVLSYLERQIDALQRERDAAEAAMAEEDDE